MRSTHPMLWSLAASLLLGACTNLAAAPVPLPDQSQPLKVGSSAEIIAATQGLPSSVIAAGDGSLVAPGSQVIAAGAGNVIAAGAGNVLAGGAGNVVAAGAGNVVAAGAGNLAPGSAALDAGSGALPEVLNPKLILDGSLDPGLLSHGPGRVAVHVRLAKAGELRRLVLHFDPRVPFPTYHVLKLYGPQDQPLATHLVQHGKAELAQGKVEVMLSGEHRPLALRVVGPEGVSLGLRELEAFDGQNQSLTAGASAELLTRADF